MISKDKKLNEIESLNKTYMLNLQNNQYSDSRINNQIEQSLESNQA